MGGEDVGGIAYFNLSRKLTSKRIKRDVENI